MIEPAQCQIVSKYQFMNYVQWGSEIRPFKILEIQTFEGRISNGSVFKWSGFNYGYRHSPNHSKTERFKMFLSGFQMVFDKMVATYPDFKLLGFRISDHIYYLDHLQPNLFSTIQNPD